MTIFMQKTKITIDSSLSRDIDNPKLLQSEYIRGKPDHTQAKVVVSDAMLPTLDNYFHVKETKLSIDYFLRY